jgi:hypothetical protein
MQASEFHMWKVEEVVLSLDVRSNVEQEIQEARVWFV